VVVVDEKSETSTHYRHKKAQSFIFDETEEESEVDDDWLEYLRTGISKKALAQLAGLCSAGGGLCLMNSDVVKHTADSVLRLASSALKCQGWQEAALYSQLLKLLGTHPDVSGHVTHYAKMIVDEATWTGHSGCVTQLRHAITGPRKGGKTTFLQVLNRVALLRFLANGQYNKTLIVSMDMRKLKKVFGDPLKLYTEIVNLTFGFLAGQRFEFGPFKKAMVQYFHQLPVIKKFVDLPQAFVLRDEFRDGVPNLTDLALTLFGIVNKQHVLSDWLSTVVHFPRLVALAFGFGGVHFVVDHFDEADIDLIPAPPFDAHSDSVTLIEYFKLMLSKGTYVLSCTDEDPFHSALEPLTADGIDIRDSTKLVTIVDVDQGHADRYIFPLKVDGEIIGINLRMADCGGCLGFLHLWDGLVLQADRLQNEEKRDARSRPAKELRLSLLAKIRELSSLVLLKVDCDDGNLTPINKRISDFAIVGTGAELDREPVQTQIDDD
jgi:hypothetical protein